MKLLLLVACTLLSSLSLRRLLIPALTALFLCVCVNHVLAADRIIYYLGQQLPPTWLTQQERNHRIELGTIMLAEGLNGVYSNLSVLPSPGLYVTVGPTLGNTNGIIFQLVPDDTSAYGDTTTHLPADPTQIVADALLNGQSAPVGPLAAPTSAGQEIIYLIEAQVVPSNDHDQQAQTFLDNQGNPSSVNVNELRSDDAALVAKGSAPGVTPSQPTADSGYIPVAYVTVSTGQTSISAGNILMNPATAFNGFAQVGTVTANSCAFFDANKHISSGGCNTAYGSPTTVSAGSSNVIVTQTTGGNYAIDIARALNMTAATYSGNATISPANGATSSVNYGSAGAFGLQNSIWNGTAAQTHTWAWNALPSGALVAQYDGSAKWTIDNAGNVTATSFNGALNGNGSGLTNLPLNQFSGLTASTCLRTSSPTTIVSAAGDCIVAGSAGVSANSSVCTDTNAALTTSGCLFSTLTTSAQVNGSCGGSFNTLVGDGLCAGNGATGGSPISLYIRAPNETVAGPSQLLCFEAGTLTGGQLACMNATTMGSAGVLEIGPDYAGPSLTQFTSADAYKIGGNTSCSGTGSFTGPANDGVACVVTLSSGSATWNFGSGSGYTSAPICTATDTTAVNAVKASSSPSGVALTGTGSDVINVICLKNNSGP